MRNALRVGSLFAVAVLLAVALQPVQVRATGPSDPDHVNYAAAAEGATASAATWESGYDPARAIDGDDGKAWRATANDALVVDFDGAKDVFEVHVHLADYAMPEVDLYWKQADGSYALLTAWSGNTATTLTHAVSGGVVAYGIKVSFPSPLTHTHSYNHEHQGECVEWHLHITPWGEELHCHAYETVNHTH